MTSYAWLVLVAITLSCGPTIQSILWYLTWKVNTSLELHSQLTLTSHKQQLPWNFVFAQPASTYGCLSLSFVNHNNVRRQDLLLPCFHFLQLIVPVFRSLSTKILDRLQAQFFVCQVRPLSLNLWSRYPYRYWCEINSLDWTLSQSTYPLNNRLIYVWTLFFSFKV